MQDNKEKWILNNHQSKHDMLEHEKRIKKNQAVVDKAEEARKKEVWRSIMAQKIGLKKLTNLTAKGKELNAMYQYSDKIQTK